MSWYKKIYIDTTLLHANASNYGLNPSDMTVAGLTLARIATYSTDAEGKAVPPLLGELPLMHRSLTADAGCSVGALRHHLSQLGIVDWTLVQQGGETSVAISQGLEYHGDHLICGSSLSIPSSMSKPPTHGHGKQTVELPMFEC